jgi:hypothetical protein
MPGRRRCHRLREPIARCGVALGMEVCTLPRMLSQVEILLEGLPRTAQFVLRDLLSEEVGDSGIHALVRCGENRSLLHVTADALVLYFVEEDPQQGASGRLLVRTVRISKPNGARISEDRELVQDRNSAVLLTTKLTAEHDSFPGGRLEFEGSQLQEETIAPVRELFQSWVAEA